MGTITKSACDYLLKYMKFKLFLTLLVSLLVFSAAALISAQSVSNASIFLKKEPSGLFTLTINEPQGIKEFSLVPPGKFPYSGTLGCYRSYENKTVVFDDPADFTPFMPATIVDCAGNTTEFKIPPPEKGVTRGEKVVKEEPKPVPPPTPRPSPTQEKPREAEPTIRPTGGAAVKPAVELPESKREAAKKDIVYPVAELGNCENETQCRSYCDEPSRIEQCINFAEKHGLMSEAEAERGRKFIPIAKQGGPGGCKTEEGCVSYCEDVEHLDECLEFGEKNGFLEGRELEEAKLVHKSLKEGRRLPGSCRSKAGCDLYCEETDHLDECLDFAENSGLIPEEELKMAKKMLPLIKSGETPGGCKSKEECEDYCMEPSNMEICLAFGEKHGLIPAEELEMAKKFLPLMQKGETPGKCKSKEECEEYCEEEGNMDECIEFAEKAGFMSPEEVEMAKKFSGLKRPGGCKSKEQCESYCEEEENMDECIEFAESAGILDPEQRKMMEFAKKLGCKGKEECETLCSDPVEGKRCQALFEELGIEMPGGDMGGPGGFSGPGGCQSPEECEAFCTENPEECQDFMPPGLGGDDFGGGFPGGPGGFPGGPGGFPGGPGGFPGGPDGGFPGGPGGFPGGPGGCRSVQECTDYCTKNYTDPACDDLGGGGGIGGGKVCDYVKPPEGCSYSQGPNYNSQTKCGLVLACPTTKPIQSCVPPPTGLVNWIHGDSISGTGAPGVTTVPGKVGNAFKFDGSGAYVTLGNQANLNFGTGPFSLDVWFNWDGGGSSVKNIIRKSNYPASGPGSGYWLRIGAGTLEFSVGETTKPEGQTIITAPVSSGDWHHVVAVKDASGDVKLYVDGESRGTVLRQASNANSTSEAPFTLGAWDDRFGVTEFFSGLIDEVSIYNRALTSDEVRAIWNAGSNGKCSASSGSSSSSSASDQYQQQYQKQYEEEYRRQYEQQYQQQYQNLQGPSSNNDISLKSFLGMIKDLLSPLP